jgi:small subunit ribosomal protein S16
LKESADIMAVKIRLARGGRKSLPVYSIVAADSRASRDKKFIERLGFYAPKARGAEVPFSLNDERLTHWVGVGAQVTDVVARLMVKHNVGPEAVRNAFVKAKARRIKAAEVIAAQKAVGEKLKADAAAKAEAAAAAAKAEAEAAKAAAEAEAKAAAEAAAAAAAQPAEAPAEQPQA